MQRAHCEYSSIGFIPFEEFRRSYGIIDIDITLHSAKYDIQRTGGQPISRETRQGLFYSLIAVMLFSMAVFFFYSDYMQEDAFYREDQARRVQTTLETLLETYSRVTDLLFETLISQPEILEMVSRAWLAGDSPERDSARKHLLALLDPVYAEMEKNSFRQLHFHFPDDVSFLRFHRPGKYGDDLTGVRHTVSMANKTGKRVTGFEEGRIFNGYRFVFPLKWKGRHIGTVETSISMVVVSRMLTNLTGGATRFLIKSNVVGAKVFESELSNYTNSTLSPDYMLDRAFLEEQGRIDNETIDAIDRRRASDAQTGMKTGKSFTLETRSKGEDYLLVFEPILNIDGEQVAYIVHYQRDAVYSSFFGRFAGRCILTGVALCLAIYLIFLRQRFVEHLRREAETDELTGALNRRKMLAITEQALYRVSRYGGPLGLILFDMDKFKTVNDTMGHEAGDDALKIATRTCGASLRKTDRMARWGGDEFVILLPDTDLEGSANFAERIRKDVKKAMQQAGYPITLSLGVTEAVENDTPDTLAARADEAMYRAKQDGGDGVKR